MYFRTMTNQEKFDFLTNTVGISEEGAMAYVSPFIKLVEDPTLNLLAHQTHDKVTEWVRNQNTEYSLKNPKKGILGETLGQ